PRLVLCRMCARLPAPRLPRQRCVRAPWPTACRWRSSSGTPWSPRGSPCKQGVRRRVHSCVHRETHGEFAVKVVDKRAAGTGDTGGVFFGTQQVKQAVGLHPHVVRLVGHVETSGRLCLVLDLLSGGMLPDRIVALSHYSEKCAAELVRNVLSALAHVHSRGYLHRDLKPENLLLRHRATAASSDTAWLSDVCLADFGLAGKILGGACCGTPPYIAPEVIMAGYYGTQSQPYDAKCDIWSLGVVSYLLLSGRMPFGGHSHRETFRRIVSNDWGFIGEIWKKISPNATAFVAACLTPDANKRPSAKELLHHA
ncbi:myosin light chain kinase, partial [Trypanosoma conorhini]